MVSKYACDLDISSDYFFVTFIQVGLSHFCYSIIYNKVNGQGIPGGLNFSYFLHTNSSEISLVFWSWSEDMHAVWI